MLPVKQQKVNPADNRHGFLPVTPVMPLQSDHHLQAAVSHIGIAVADLDESIKRYTLLLNQPPAHLEDVPDQLVKVAMFEGTTSQGRVELVAATSDKSPIAKFIATRGEGLHHLCLYVDDLRSTLERLKGAGVRLIDQEPRRGAEGKLIAFVHPASMGGVLIELEERAKI